MANITRFDPFSDLVSFTPVGNFEELFAVPQVRKFVRNRPAEPEIKVDVSEDDNAYYVKAEVPGVNKDDIQVTVDDDRVSITAEVKRETEEKKGEKVLRCERYYGMQSRSFTLMHNVDQSKAEAKYQDGILELTLPKKTNGGTVKQVTVK